MTKRFNKGIAEVFLDPGDEISFFNTLLPIPVHRFLDEQFYYDPNHEHTRIYKLHKAKLTVQKAQGFDSGIDIYTFAFEKITDANNLFDTILENFSQEDYDLLKQEALLHTDDRGKFCFKIGLNELRAGNFKLVDKPPCVQMTFLIAAYPKNPTTIREGVKSLFDTHLSKNN